MSGTFAFRILFAAALTLPAYGCGMEVDDGAIDAPVAGEETVDPSVTQQAITDQWLTFLPSNTERTVTLSCCTHTIMHGYYLGVIFAKVISRIAGCEVWSELTVGYGTAGNATV